MKQVQVNVRITTGVKGPINKTQTFYFSTVEEAKQFLKSYKMTGNAKLSYEIKTKDSELQNRLRNEASQLLQSSFDTYYAETIQPIVNVVNKVSSGTKVTTAISEQLSDSISDPFALSKRHFEAIGNLFVGSTKFLQSLFPYHVIEGGILQ